MTTFTTITRHLLTLKLLIATLSITDTRVWMKRVCCWSRVFKNFIFLGLAFDFRTTNQLCWLSSRLPGLTFALFDDLILGSRGSYLELLITCILWSFVQESLHTYVQIIWCEETVYYAKTFDIYSSILALAFENSVHHLLMWYFFW